MNNYEKKRLEELDAKADFLLAQQDEQDRQMNQLFARLVYMETRLYRLMQQFDIDPDLMESIETIRQDVQAINLACLPFHQLN